MTYSVLSTIPRATSSLRKSHNKTFFLFDADIDKTVLQIDHDDSRLKILIRKIFCQNIA